MARGERLGLEHRLSRRRPQFPDPPRRAHQGARSAGSRRATSNHLVVRATDPFLFQCPFLLASDIGTAQFAPEEVVALRAYFDKGGFLWVDDFWGERAWQVWVEQMSRILPPDEFPILDVPPAHPLWRTVFEVKALPQIPAISHWRRSGGETSERGARDRRPRPQGHLRSRRAASWS